MLWQYNQIVGYITVSVSNDDIVFKIYKPINRKIRYDSSKKQYMEDLHYLGTHFYIGNRSDEQLIAEIKTWIADIIKENIKKTLYVDKSLFDATIDCININKLIDIRKKQYRGI